MSARTSAIDHFPYKPLAFSIRKKLNDFLRRQKSPLKGLPWQSAYFQMIDLGVDDVRSTVEALIWEHYYLNSPFCLVPETSQLVSDVTSLNFEPLVDSMRLPYNQFTIGIPKKVRFNGTKVKGLFVSYLTKRERIEYYRSFNSKFNILGNEYRGHYSDTSDDDRKIMFISYKDAGSDARVVVELESGKIQEALKNGYGYYELNEGSCHNGPKITSLTVDDNKTQTAVIRFVCAFIIHMNNHGDAIKIASNIRMKGKAEKQDNVVRLVTIRKIKRIGGLTPYYRYLRHDKYYQREYENWPRGTRCVPVNMIVGVVTSHTSMPLSA